VTNPIINSEVSYLDIGGSESSEEEVNREEVLARLDADIEKVVDGGDGVKEKIEQIFSLVCDSHHVLELTDVIKYFTRAVKLLDGVEISEPLKMIFIENFLKISSLLSGKIFGPSIQGENSLQEVHSYFRSIAELFRFGESVEIFQDWKESAVECFVRLMSLPCFEKKDAKNYLKTICVLFVAPEMEEFEPSKLENKCGAFASHFLLSVMGKLPDFEKKTLLFEFFVDIEDLVIELSDAEVEIIFDFLSAPNFPFSVIVEIMTTLTRRFQYSEESWDKMVVLVCRKVEEYLFQVNNRFGYFYVIQMLRRQPKIFNAGLLWETMGRCMQLKGMGLRDVLDLIMELREKADLTNEAWGLLCEAAVQKVHPHSSVTFVNLIAIISFLVEIDNKEFKTQLWGKLENEICSLFKKSFLHDLPEFCFSQRIRLKSSEEFASWMEKINRMLELWEFAKERDPQISRYHQNIIRFILCAVALNFTSFTVEHHKEIMRLIVKRVNTEKLGDLTKRMLLGFVLQICYYHPVEYVEFYECVHELSLFDASWLEVVKPYVNVLLAQSAKHLNSGYLLIETLARLFNIEEAEVLEALTPHVKNKTLLTLGRK